MHVYILTFLFAQLFFSCKNKNIDHSLIIKATIKKIPSKKVYLVEAHEWYKFLDSADYLNDTFSFHITPKDQYIPFMASISYIDSVDTKIKTVQFRNYVLSPPPDSTKYIMTAFILEAGKTEMTGELGSFNQILLSTGSQTEAMYNAQMMSFGHVDEEKKDSRKSAINKYKKLILKYPSSYYFLGEIINNKEFYTSDELKEYLSLFTAEVKKSKLANILYGYLATRPDLSKPLKELPLETDKGVIVNAIDKTSKLNMLVFWASWCAPCRKEIPILKDMYIEYKNKGLSISSISLDEDKKKWVGALEQEKMIWNQFIVDSGDIDTVKKQFDFSALPFTVIIDKNGKILSRSVGFDSQKKDDERYKFLDSLLKN